MACLLSGLPGLLLPGSSAALPDLLLSLSGSSAALSGLLLPGSSAALSGLLLSLPGSSAAVWPAVVIARQQCNAAWPAVAGPVHHKGAIQRSISTANGGKITNEYSRGHQILSVGRISSILIKICQEYGKIAPRG